MADPVTYPATDPFATTAIEPVAAEPVADTTEVEIIEFPKELFMFKRPVEKPVLPSPVLGTRTVNSAEEQAAAEAEGWFADQASAAAAVDAEPEPEPEPIVDDPSF
jgi:hypothetical protein